MTDIDYDKDSFFDSLLSQLNDGVPSLKGKAKAKAENDHASDLLLKEIIQQVQKKQQRGSTEGTIADLLESVQEEKQRADLLGLSEAENHALMQQEEQQRTKRLTVEVCTCTS